LYELWDRLAETVVESSAEDPADEASALFVTTGRRASSAFDQGNRAVRRQVLCFGLHAGNNSWSDCFSYRVSAQWIGSL
jgi:hypothetical protein